MSVTKEKARSERRRELHRSRWRLAHAVLVRVTLEWSSAESDEKRDDPICRSGRNAATGAWNPGTWSRFCDITSAVWENNPRSVARGTAREVIVYHIPLLYDAISHPQRLRSTISIGHYTAAPSLPPPPHYTVYNKDTAAATPQPTQLPTLPPPTYLRRTMQMGLSYTAGCLRSRTTVVTFFNSLKRRQKRKNVFVCFAFFAILWEAYFTVQAYKC